MEKEKKGRRKFYLNIKLFKNIINDKKRKRNAYFTFIIVRDDQLILMDYPE